MSERWCLRFDGFDPEETGVTLLQNAWIKAAALRDQVDDDALVEAVEQFTQQCQDLSQVAVVTIETFE